MYAYITIIMYGRDKIQTFEIENLAYFTRFGFYKSENHNFSGFSTCVCKCLSIINITQQLIAAETSNLVFYICIIRRYDMKLFMKTG